MHSKHPLRGSGHPTLKGLVILLGGQICMAASVIFIKASTIEPSLLAADRLLLSAVLLLPFWGLERQRGRRQVKPCATPEPAATGMSNLAGANPGLSHRFRQLLLEAILPGILLGFHFITWNLGARTTAASHASMIVNLVPMALPFFVFAMTREKPGRREILGTVVACGGLLALGLTRLDGSSGSLQGDLLCFVAMLLFTAYIAFARRKPRGGIWSYVVPIYGVGGVTALLCSLPFGNPLAQPLAIGDVVAILGLTLGSTMIGHSSSNWAMRHFHPQVVSLFTVTQFIWAGLMAWIIYNERPDGAFYLSAMVVLAGCLIVLRPWQAMSKAKNC